MYDHVLLPTDGSEGTQETIDHALGLAADHGATLHALYVVDTRQYFAAPDDVAEDVLDSLHEEGERAIDAVRERVEAAGVEFASDIVEGIPYKEIIEHVGAHDIDVVVMGTHGHTGRDRVVRLGSVTERVLKNVSVPVFVVNIGED